jgi:hypothetical protein
MKKLGLLIVGLVGFMLGSRAGRGPYEQLENWARQISGRPQVQQAANQVTESGKHLGDVATRTASTGVDRAAEAAADAITTATDRVTKNVEDVEERIESQ